MKFSTVAAISGLAGIAAADYGVLVIRSGSALQYQQLNATGNAFWAGKPTATYCPDNTAVKCPIGDGETLFASGLSLSVVVPGGQQTYVEANGAVGWTTQHSAALPEGATVGGFGNTEGASFGEITSDHPLLLCPEGEGSIDGKAYKLYTKAPGVSFADACLEIGAITVNATGPGAWAYA